MHPTNRRCALLPISDPKLRRKLFDNQLLPILSYASEVWGADEKIGDTAELLHRQFLKHMLGVRDSTANVIVLAELGRFPLRFHWWQQILRYHNRINNLSDDERLIKCAFVEGMHDTSHIFWSHRVHNWLQGSVKWTGASQVNPGYEAVAMEKAMRWAILSAEEAAEPVLTAFVLPW